MDPGSVPAELQSLSEVEELLIARAFPIMSIYRKHGYQVIMVIRLSWLSGSKVQVSL